MTARADSHDPDLRRTHEERHRDDLAAFFSEQADVVVPLVAQGSVSLDQGRWDRDLARIVFDRGKDAAADFGRMVFGLLGRSARFDPDLMDDWLEETAGNTAERINAATLDSVMDAASADDPGAEAEALFAGLVAVRSGVYATSMVTTASNFGAHDGARAGGAQRKTWRTNSGKPRADHSAMSGQTVGIDEAFSNGMRWPGDPAGGAEQVANCQCSLSFAQGGG